MAKIKGLKKAFDNIEKSVNNAIKSNELKKQIGEFLVQDITQTMAKGRVVSNGKLVNNPGLEKETIKRRGSLETVNPTSGDYSQRKSNLIFTGQLIKSVTYRAIAKGIEIFSKGNHKPYKGNRGGKVGKSVANAKIFEGQASGAATGKSRLIFALTRARISRIRGFLRSALRRS